MRFLMTLQRQSAKTDAIRSLPPPTETVLRLLRHARLRRGTERLAGRHPSLFLGFSTVFETARPYCPGDDIRFLDHRLLARTDRDYVRLATTEASTLVVLVVDDSASMDFEGKFDWACRFAYLGACIAQAFGDRWSLSLGSGGTTQLPPGRGPSHLSLTESVLGSARPSGACSPEALLRPVLPILRPGVTAVIVSDFIAPLSDIRKALEVLGSTGAQAAFLWILSRTERTFPFTGTLRFIDPETGRRSVLSADALAAAYREALETVAAALDRFARKRNFPFLELDPQASDPQQVWQRLVVSWEAKRLW